MTDLKKLRYEKGLTQQQLADAIGVTRQTIICIEGDSRVSASSESMQAVCRFFGVSPFEVFSAKDVLKLEPRTREDAAKLISLIKKEYLCSKR